MTRDVTVIGPLNIDLLIVGEGPTSWEDIPAWDGPADMEMTAAGSVGYNVSDLAKLGMDVQICSCVSDDALGAFIIESLRRVDAEHLKDRPPYKLSVGEKRRVAIAAVLAMSPDILVMDEPSSSLDPQSRRELIELLQTFEHTKIIATHDLDLALQLCPRTIVLGDGKVLADGPTTDIFADEALLTQSRLEKPLSMQNCPRCGGNAPPA